MHDTRSAYIKSGSLYEPAVYDFGVHVLKEHVRAAAMAFTFTTTSLTKAQAIAESVAFIKGSDLDFVLAAVDTTLDPERFRERFYEWCERKRRKFLKSQS